MSTSLVATFDTRREAEMTVERLVQQFNLDRESIFITSESDENSAGDEKAGSDTKAGEPSAEERTDAPLNGTIVVTLEVPDEDMVEKVRDAFSEFDAAGVVETNSAES